MGAHPEELLALMPFAAGTGVELDRADPAEVAGRLAWAPERCTAGGLMHGGALMTLADSVGAVCAFLNLPPGASTATVSYDVAGTGRAVGHRARGGPAGA